MPARKVRVKRKVKRNLALAMNPQDAKEIVAELAAEVETLPEQVERVPGATIDGNKVIWTYNAMCEKFPVVPFIPEETIPLTWNGVRVMAVNTVEMHVPKPFYDLYMKHRRGVNIKQALPAGITLEQGAGLL